MYMTKLLLSHSDINTHKITDTYSLHRVVYGLFEDVRTDEEKKSSIPSGIQWVDKGSDGSHREIFILSDRAPIEQTTLNVATKTVPDALFDVQHLAFDVIINPVKQMSKTRKYVPLTSYEDIAQWFQSRAQQWGFSVTPDSFYVEVLQADKFQTNQKITINRARIAGHLTVTDKNLFRRAFTSGIGRQRAFGCGLLQIVPANR